MGVEEGQRGGNNSQVGGVGNGKWAFLLVLLSLRRPNIISYHSLFSDRIEIYKERLFISYCSGGWDVKELVPASIELAPGYSQPPCCTLGVEGQPACAENIAERLPLRRPFL